MSRVTAVLCFCFQAEDGIRDLVRSRGLGDVYKRQILDCIGVGSDSTLPTKVGRKICRELLDETPLLIIADDIDSLENTEEEAIEFLNYDIPRTSSKVLITSRRKLLGLGACTTMVEGLSEAESEIFVVKRAASLGLDAVSYTHLPLPTSDQVEISVVAVSLKKKKT